VEAVDASEAAATNVLLRAVLGMAGPEGVAISDDDAARAARFLAERAHRSLGDGLDAAVVASRWAGRWRSGRPACGRCSRIVHAEAWCEACGEELCGRCWGDGDEFLCDVCRHRRTSPFEDVPVTSGAL
jgi:hypothetical protein